MFHTCYWNNEVLSPIQKYGMRGDGGVAFKRLRILLDRVMLRRTKIERADDLGLPPRTVIVRKNYFSREEKELYESLFTDATRQFSTYVDAGTLLNSEILLTLKYLVGADLLLSRLLKCVHSPHTYETNGMPSRPRHPEQEECGQVCGR